ncbi:hypothetical protein HMPREF1989_01893 [Porphyromonas gingivalis F0566]|nr:hypothetical protein HMPREF1989_01893 [Porphyromonas gingivalis F0566]
MVRCIIRYKYVKKNTLLKRTQKVARKILFSGAGKEKFSNQNENFVA